MFVVSFWFKNFAKLFYMADHKKKSVKKNDDDTDESNSKLDSSIKNMNFVNF